MEPFVEVDEPYGAKDEPGGVKGEGIRPKPPKEGGGAVPKRAASNEGKKAQGKERREKGPRVSLSMRLKAAMRVSAYEVRTEEDRR